VGVLLPLLVPLLLDMLDFLFMPRCQSPQLIVVLVRSRL
jgi:hypothetical protein